MRFITMFCVVALLLAACGQQDVHSACYANGDHEHLSDGRITRICDCVDDSVKKGSPTEKEKQWIIMWFNKKPLKAATSEEKKQAEKLVAEIIQLKARCEAVR